MEERVTIQGYSKKGKGLAISSSQKKCEIPHTVSGDTVLASIHKKKGKLLEVITPSLDRTPPRCSHVGTCGGCSWQQIAYPSQLREKQDLIEHLFEKWLISHSAILHPIMESDPWEYRNKMEFTFSENRAGMRYLGLMIAEAPRYVFNLTECHLVKPWFAKVVNEVRIFWENSSFSAYNLMGNRGILRYLTLKEAFRSGEKMVILTISPEGEKEDFAPFLQAIKKALPSEEVEVVLRIQRAEKKVATTFEEKVLSGKGYILEKLLFPDFSLFFQITPASFFQPNPLQAEKLYLKAIELLNLKKSEVVFDLYCGTGTLGMIASPFVKEVIGIEKEGQSVGSAKENLKRNQIKNMKIYEGDVGKVLKGSSFPTPDVVMVDPPRAGLDEKALEQLCALSPEKILYISCNPYTQVENIEALSSTYQLETLQPIDQFPHTHHIENIALLRRRKA